MKLTLIAEGSTKWQRLIKHWGLSILIDDDILFDTFGKPDYVLGQLSRLSVDINKIKNIVISHDDWDHVTGLWKILERNNSATIYVCPNFSPDIKAKIKWYGARFIEVDRLVEIRNGIYVSGELKGGSRGGVALPEQYLAIKTPKGVVVITGCAHPGIVEIVQHAKEAFHSDIRLLIGGFHLKDNSDRANLDIVSKLKEIGVRQIIPLHCTGNGAKKILIQEYGPDCISIDSGHSILV
jgi:7,8-dihydropterin-6-yl-methyl-4-(beta-D-ribofuranosyl)aminobenzene 5'-phosphate synthase